ncbi:unknown [Prevotella sp. CAG:487]|nr:unknown [Prevotella sp. CAG:487]
MQIMVNIHINILTLMIGKQTHIYRNIYKQMSRI